MKFTLPQVVSKPVEQNVEITLGFDSDGDPSIYYNGINVAYINSCGTINTICLDANDKSKLVALGIDFDCVDNDCISTN